MLGPNATAGEHDRDFRKKFSDIEQNVNHERTPEFLSKNLPPQIIGSRLVSAQAYKEIEKQLNDWKTSSQRELRRILDLVIIHTIQQLFPDLDWPEQLVSFRLTFENDPGAVADLWYEWS